MKARSFILVAVGALAVMAAASSAQAGDDRRGGYGNYRGGYHQDYGRHEYRRREYRHHEYRQPEYRPQHYYRPHYQPHWQPYSHYAPPPAPLP